MATITRTVKLHPSQLAFRRSEALYRGFVGGRGAGKSWAGAYDLLRRLRPGRTYLVGSPTGVLMQDTTFPTFRALAEDLGVWGGARLSPYPTATVLLEGGEARVRFRTADDPERMRGPNLSAAWLDEASLMSAAAFDVVIGCLREGGRVGWLSATFTPKALDHWTTLRFAADPPMPDTEAFRARTADNPFLPPGYEANLRRQYDDLTAARELGGEFVDVEGAEWPASYFPDSIYFDDWPPDLVCRVQALDPSKGRDAKSGDYQAHVCLGMDRRGGLWLDADLRREPDWVSRALSVAAAFGPLVLVAESNATMGLLMPEVNRQLAERAAAGRPVVASVKEVHHTLPKAARVRIAGGYLARGQVRVRNTPGGRLLVSQWRQFPHGRHDDGPDAAGSAILELQHLYAGA